MPTNNFNSTKPDWLGAVYLLRYMVFAVEKLSP